MVIAFSTIPGYVSNRDKERGTWFIQSLCKVISEDDPEVLTRTTFFINFLLFFYHFIYFTTVTNTNLWTDF